MSIWLHPNWKGSSSSFFFGALLTCLCLLLFFLFFSPWGRASLRWCQFAVIISIRSQLKQLANPPSHASSAARIICVCFLTRRRDCANLLWGETGEREGERGRKGERDAFIRQQKRQNVWEWGTENEEQSQRTDWRTSLFQTLRSSSDWRRCVNDVDSEGNENTTKWRNGADLSTDTTTGPQHGGRDPMDEFWLIVFDSRSPASHRQTRTRVNMM